jgi:hypothetical protein
MSRLLFQGVDGVADSSESLRINSLITEQRPLTTLREADKLHEECGVVAIYGHPHAAREALRSTPCSTAVRNPPASPPLTASISPTSRAWAWFLKFSRTTFS